MATRKKNLIKSLLWLAAVAVLGAVYSSKVMGWVNKTPLKSVTDKLPK